MLYRHEPDELTLPEPGLRPSQQVAQWLRQRGVRASAKRPYFVKSWRLPPLDKARRVFAAALAAAQRLPLSSEAASRIFVPDLVTPNRWASVRGALKLVNWDGSVAAQAMPNARCIFIIRHPGGQIASLMTGVAGRKFGRASDEADAAVDMAAAMAWARRNGVDSATFEASREAAKWAWAWRAFNEPAIEALSILPNAKIVIYEDLCRQPEAVARDLFAFAGLDWHQQSAAFLGLSTHDTRGGYYDVFRSTGSVVDRWRHTMSEADQYAIRSVIATSPLARCWPDLGQLAA